MYLLYLQSTICACVSVLSLFPTKMVKFKHYENTCKMEDQCQICFRVVITMYHDRESSAKIKVKVG